MFVCMSSWDASNIEWEIWEVAIIALIFTLELLSDKSDFHIIHVRTVCNLALFTEGTENMDERNKDTKVEYPVRTWIIYQIDITIFWNSTCHIRENSTSHSNEN